MKKISAFAIIAGAAFLFSFFNSPFTALENGGEDGALIAAGIPQVGQPAPDFALKDASGKKIFLSNYKGKVVMINFWATWCPPCRQEMPSMEELFQEYNKKGFEILAVSSDSQAEKIVKPFMEFYELTFSALMDADGAVHSLYGVTSIPTTYIINKQGNVTHKIMGPRDWKDKNTKSLIEKLLQ